MKLLITVFCAAALLAPSAEAAAKKKAAVAKPALKTAAARKKTAAKKVPAKKTVPTHAAQQHPTADRYTQIEQALVDRGYLDTATGEWGASAAAALKKFQADQGLHSDGKLGALTLTAMGLGPKRTPGLDILSSVATAGD
jgi:peptidoglycan hydrolase-like protein with peptidoglycan-binding domain